VFQDNKKILHFLGDLNFLNLTQISQVTDEIIKIMRNLHLPILWTLKFTKSRQTYLDSWQGILIKQWYPL